MPRLPLVLAMAPLLSAPGCCSLARLFCGPERSEWVQVDYETPANTLRTFLEALRRDSVDRVCESLSEDFKKARGIDGMTAHLAWQKLREQNPYLYMAGYATVPDQPTRQNGDRAAFDLEVQGYALHVELVRQPYWLVHFLWPDGSVHERSVPLASLAPYLQLPGSGDPQPPDTEGYVPIVFKNPEDWRQAPHFRLHRDYDEPGLEQIVRVEYGQEWKLSELVMPRPE